MLGEDADDDGNQIARCPGAGCHRWESAAGSYAEKMLQTRSCDRCHGNAPLEHGASGQSSGDQFAKRVVARIETLVRRQRAGMRLNLADLSFLEWQLVQVWHEEEKRIEHKRQAGLAQTCEMIKAFLMARTAG